MTPKEKIQAERWAITALIRIAKDHGYKLTRVWSETFSERPQSEKDALDAVFSVEGCTIVFAHDSQSVSKYVIVARDRGWNCLIGYSTGESWTSIIAEVKAHCKNRQEELRKENERRT